PATGDPPARFLDLVTGALQATGQLAMSPAETTNFQKLVPAARRQFAHQQPRDASTLKAGLGKLAAMPGRTGAIWDGWMLGAVLFAPLAPHGGRHELVAAVIEKGRAIFQGTGRALVNTDLDTIANELKLDQAGLDDVRREVLALWLETGGVRTDPKATATKHG